jgi:thioredoxin 1
MIKIRYKEVFYMTLTHLTSETFDQAVNAGDDLVVVDFFATWCGPCKMLFPVIKATVEKMAELHPEVHFYKVDIDEDMDLATRFKVMSVPTLLYFRRGVVANKTIGVISASEMEQAIAKAK